MHVRNIWTGIDYIIHIFLLIVYNEEYASVIKLR